MAPFLGRLGSGGGTIAGFGFGKNKFISPAAGGGVSFSATGGTKTVIGSYTYHDFTSTGPSPFVVTGGPYSINMLLIGGGGGGGCNTPGDGGSAGGGAGGVIIAPITLTAGSYTVVVGGGGAGGSASSQHGINGTDSTFGSDWVAQGGGRGVNYIPSPVTTQGGSPGGAYGNTISPLTQTNNPALPINSRIYGIGNLGVSNAGAPGYGGGGGGGAGTRGNVGIPDGPGVGGAGLPTNTIAWLNTTPFFSPTSQYFAGGGGGASRAGNSAGGSGGGGAGNHGGTATSGTNNTGSGGGGGAFPGGTGGTGGSGRVIIAYLTSDPGSPLGCTVATGPIPGTSITYSINGGPFTAWGGSATNLAGGYYEISTGWTTIAWRFALSTPICGQALGVSWITGNDPATAPKPGYFYINDVSGTQYPYAYSPQYFGKTNLGEKKNISSFTMVISGSNSGNTGLIGTDSGAQYGFTIDGNQLR